MYNHFKIYQLYLCKGLIRFKIQTGDNWMSFFISAPTLESNQVPMFNYVPDAPSGD